MSVYEIISTILMVVFGFLSLYIKTKTKIIDKAKDAVNTAEETYKDATKSGGIKFEYCIDMLYGYVPAVMKPFITREFMAMAVQKAFDAMAKFATQQLDKLVDKTGE